MSYFLILFILVFSLNSLSDTSCKDQKNLLKSACSLKLEKPNTKFKNLSTLESCKKIKDLFLDLKTKTKKNYELCQKAYKSCKELCNKCDKSLVSKFKERSKKNLKKIKKGYTKASKCVNQLSSDFEQKKEDRSFNPNPYTKEFLQFLKSEKLKEKKKKEIEHQKLLKEQEKKEFGKKLGNQFRQIHKRLELSSWAKKHNISISKKSTEEIEKIKKNYQLNQKKKKERIKLEKKRKEILKKKIKADFLKTNPPQTKTDMAFEAIKETFSSYWNKTKRFFGRVFFGEFAIAEEEHQCPFIDGIFSKKEIFQRLQNFIIQKHYDKTEEGSFFIQYQPNSTGYDKFNYSSFMEKFFDEFRKNLHKMMNDVDVCTEINIFLNDTSDILMSDNELTNQKAQGVYIGLKRFGLLSYAQGRFKDLEMIKRLEGDTVFQLCNILKNPLSELQNAIKKLKIENKIDSFRAKDLALLLNHTTENNMYHIMAYLFAFRQNIDNPGIPEQMKNFLSAYFESMESVNSEQSLFAVPFIVFYLLKETFFEKESPVIEYNQFNYMIKEEYYMKYSIEKCVFKEDLKTNKVIDSICKYKPPLSIAIDQMREASQKEYGIAYVQFYERYIASLLFIARADIRETQYLYNHTDYDTANYVDNNLLRNKSLKIIGDAEKNSKEIDSIKNSLKNTRKCFKAKN